MASLNAVYGEHAIPYCSREKNVFELLAHRRQQQIRPLRPERYLKRETDELESPCGFVETFPSDTLVHRYQFARDGIWLDPLPTAEKRLDFIYKDGKAQQLLHTNPGEQGLGRLSDSQLAVLIWKDSHVRGD